MFQSLLNSSKSMGRLSFARRDEGTVTIFALLMLIMMLLAGGMAIDFIRVENQRVKLQSTLDRAILAAANMSSTLDPEDVVIDYFSKAGLQDYVLDVDVMETSISRTVAAQAYVDTNSIFLNMVGIDTLRAPARGEAAQSAANVEISLVLDVSGSMSGQVTGAGVSKLSAMQTAAKEFITTVSASAGLSVSIVTYNDRIYLEPDMASYFPLAAVSPSSTCVMFSETQFTHANLIPTEDLERVAKYDFSSSGSSTPPSTFQIDWCEEQWGNRGEILPWTNDIVELETFVDSLSAGGNTAIDLGMKWGVMLLDPSTQTNLENMAMAGHVPTELIGRPASYSEGSTLKIVVLMTDGQNTSQNDLKEQFKTGDSNVWVWDDNGQAGDDLDGELEYSVLIPSSGNYHYVDDPTTGHADPKGGTDATRLSYPELWASVPVAYVSNVIYANMPNGWTAQMANVTRTYAAGGTADNRLRNICNAAVDEDIVVFTIGFEAPSNAQALMSQCASSNAHYYDVVGLQISDAFESIARTISQLRLTQ